jgi:hypothetical protein
MPLPFWNSCAGPSEPEGRGNGPPREGTLDGRERGQAGRWASARRQAGVGKNTSSFGEFEGACGGVCGGRLQAHVHVVGLPLPQVPQPCPT